MVRPYSGHPYMMEGTSRTRPPAWSWYARKWGENGQYCLCLSKGAGRQDRRKASNAAMRHWKRWGGTATDWVPRGRLSAEKCMAAQCTVGLVQGRIRPSATVWQRHHLKGGSPRTNSTLKRVGKVSSLACASDKHATIPH